MKNLPALKSRQVIKVFRKLGFIEDRQRGSHLILIHPHTKKRVVIPVHSGRTLNKPLLQSIIEQDAGLSVEEFLKLL